MILFLCSFQIKALAKENGISTFECSALTGDDVENVFENIIMLYFRYLERRIIGDIITIIIEHVAGVLDHAR